MAEQGVKHMKTIANEYKEYITERTRLSDNGIKLTAYSFENGYQARVIENLDSNIVSLVLVKFEDGKNSIKDILLELTPEQLIEKLEEIKNL
ncbi:Phage protein [Listeria monocytogenes]|nr:Phage protein [Listeria monocytogenes]